MKIYIKYLLLLMLGFVTISQIKSQTIKIGQDSKQIKMLIEWQTNNHNKPDSYGNRASSEASLDVEYQNGQIRDVVLCYENAFLIDFRIITNFCKHYIMEDGKLKYVLTQYENISLHQLESAFNNSHGEHRKIGDYYFSEDFEHYSLIYLAKNGYTTEEYRKTANENLSSNILKQIEQKKKNLQLSKNEKVEKYIAEKGVFTYSDLLYGERFEILNKKEYDKKLYQSCVDFFKKYDNKPSDVKVGDVINDSLLLPKTIYVNKDGSIDGLFLKFTPSTYYGIPVRAKIDSKFYIDVTWDDYTAKLENIPRSSYSDPQKKRWMIIAPKRGTVDSKVVRKIEKYIKYNITSSVDSLEKRNTYLKNNKTKTSKKEIKENKIKIQELKSITTFKYSHANIEIRYEITSGSGTNKYYNGEKIEYSTIINIKPIQNEKFR